MATATTTTALNAFILAGTMTADQTMMTDDTASSHGGESTSSSSNNSNSNVFLESLFVRLPIQAPTAASMVVDGGSVPLTNEEIALQTAADPLTLLAAVMRARTRGQNPVFAEMGEKHDVPAPDTNHRHYGEPCKPNERLLQVTRYGRVYKRKSPSLFQHKIKLNGPPGTRYCRFCEEHRPLEEFYTHIKRYVCRKHHAMRVHNSDVARCNADAIDGTVPWLELSMVREVFGYHAVNFDRNDIRALIIHAGIPWGMRPRIVPIDPSIPLRPRNVAVVSLPTFRMLIQLYQHTCSRALFIAHVQRCNLLPPNMDVGWPERPFHDPDYRRIDIDVGPLLTAECAGGLGECVDRSTLENLIAKEPQAPWVETPAVAVGTAMRGRLQIARNEVQRVGTKGYERSTRPLKTIEDMLSPEEKRAAAKAKREAKKAAAAAAAAVVAMG